MTDNLHGLIQEPRWCRGTARIEGDHIVLDKDATQSYGVESAEYWEELPFRLLRVIRTDSKGREKLDKQRLKLFVKDYGMLWQGPKHLADGDLSEPLDRWYDAALKLRRLTDLYKVHMEAVSKKEWTIAEIEPVRQALRALRDVDGSREAMPDDNSECLRFSADRIAVVVNEERAGADQPLVPYHRLTIAGLDEFVFTYRFATLLASAYDQLSYHIAEKARVKPCGACGASFIVRRTNQEYCPGDTCQKTAEKQRYRERKKLGADQKRAHDDALDPESTKIYAKHF